jgi:hypothetical protein
MSLSSIPECLRTKKLSEIAVKRDGLDLKYVRIEYKTEALCKAAVNNNPEALLYVPHDILMQNPEICKLAIEKDVYSASKRIPKELLTENPEISAIILDKFINLLEEISQNNLDRNLLQHQIGNLFKLSECLPEDFLEVSEIITYLKINFQNLEEEEFNSIISSINSYFEHLPIEMSGDIETQFTIDF